jgi:hypothetical protein
MLHATASLLAGVGGRGGKRSCRNEFRRRSWVWGVHTVAAVVGYVADAVVCRVCNAHGLEDTWGARVVCLAPSVAPCRPPRFSRPPTQRFTPPAFPPSPWLSGSVSAPLCMPCAIANTNRWYKNMAPKSRMLIGAGIMAYAGVGLLLSDKAEEKLGLVPTEKDREELREALPKIVAVERGSRS